MKRPRWNAYGLLLVSVALVCSMVFTRVANDVLDSLDAVDANPVDSARHLSPLPLEPGRFAALAELRLIGEVGDLPAASDRADKLEDLARQGLGQILKQSLDTLL